MTAMVDSYILYVDFPFFFIYTIYMRHSLELFYSIGTLQDKLENKAPRE